MSSNPVINKPGHEPLALLCCQWLIGTQVIKEHALVELIEFFG